jgi:hypothetical protein
MLGAFEFQGMARIGTSLKTGNNVIGRGLNVNNFSFAFVTPLKAY